jgi:hypothetical protein
VPNVVGQLMSAMPFVLAAAIAAGWRRWMAGRRWLTAAAAAYALAGGLNAATQVSLALIVGGDSPPNLDYVSAFSTGVLLGNLAAAVAMLLAAAGLWRGSSSVMQSGGRAIASRIATALAALLAVGAVISAARVVYELTTLDSADVNPLSISASVVFELSSVPLGVLGAVAIRRLPNRYLVPELLIGVGALAASITWWAWSASLFFASSSNPPIVGMTAVATVAVAQLLSIATLALGFFAARVSAAGEM